MLLSEVVESFDGKLISDGKFNRLDYCTVRENGPFLTFMENKKFLPYLLENKCISCVLCAPDIVDQISNLISGIFITSEPKVCFEEIHNNLANNTEYTLPEYDTKIGRDCNISPLAYISNKNVTIMDNVFIGPFAYIGEHVTIGNNCKVYNHATIGGRSFSYARKGDNDIIGLIDCGSVYLESDVEVMSYTHIARGILPSDCTYIGEKTVLDAHIHVGHGAKLYNRVFVAGGAIIGGNASIGNDSWIGINATVSNRITIGARSRVSLGAVVTKNIPNDTVVSGNFAIEHSKFLARLQI